MQRADVAMFAQTELVGLSKAEILACAGKPARTVSASDAESLVYIGGGDGAAAGNVKPGSEAGTGSAPSGEKYCEVTFVLRRGYVEKVTYGGPNSGAFAQGEQCAFVVQKCLPTR